MYPCPYVKIHRYVYDEMARRYLQRKSSAGNRWGMADRVFEDRNSVVDSARGASHKPTPCEGKEGSERGAGDGRDEVVGFDVREDVEAGLEGTISRVFTRTLLTSGSERRKKYSNVRGLLLNNQR